MADINKFAQFLKGFLEEQERQKTEKKLNTLMQGKDMDVSVQYDPINGKAVYNVKPKQQVPQIPGGMQGWQPTKFTPPGTGMTYENPEYLQQKELQKQESQVGAQAAKGQQEAQVNFKIAQNKLRTTMAAFKAMVEKEGAGRAGGAARVFTGATGTNPYVKAFEGQLVEAAAALAKLAAPSARVGQEIINQFKKTLPTKWATMDEATNQIRFSMHNAYATALGKAGMNYTPELQKMVDDWVNEIANVEPMRLEGLKGQQAPTQQTPQQDPLGLR